MVPIVNKFYSISWFSKRMYSLQDICYVLFHLVFFFLFQNITQCDVHFSSKSPSQTKLRQKKTVLGRGGMAWRGERRAVIKR